MEITGDFEAHVTVAGDRGDELDAFAAAHGLKVVHIEIDRGWHLVQPMLTLHASGPLGEVRTYVDGWADRLSAAGLTPVRSKIEATPWAAGVPGTDAEAAAGPPERYFEHHVKLLLPEGVTAVARAGEVADRHEARLSRNARSRPRPGFQVRFVNQRCYDVGRDTATGRLDRLAAELRADGHEILSVEQEYVVHDSNLDLDIGWLTREPFVYRPRWGSHEEWRRTTAPTSQHPPTYLPLPPTEGISQRGAFDPALKNHDYGYVAGDPVFADPVAAGHWRAARSRALTHALAVIARTRWAGHLVLRGSLTLAAWVGDAARDPRDLDFVVTPATITSAEGAELLDGIARALAADPGAGLRPAETVQSPIWTYERADGRRLVVPVTNPHGPDTAVQIDIVFGEKLPVAPRPLTLPGIGVPVTAATAPQSLAWKLRWLAWDGYPQGKDLYDAALLAEHIVADPALIAEANDFELFDDLWSLDGESVLTKFDIDWENFQDDYPGIPGTRDHWARRLAIALETIQHP